MSRGSSIDLKTSSQWLGWWCVHGVDGRIINVGAVMGGWETMGELAKTLLRFAGAALDYVNGVDRSVWRVSTVTAGDIAMLRQLMLY